MTDEPTAEVIARDGFESENKGLSWDDIQKASNAVQPRMFGKQGKKYLIVNLNCEFFVKSRFILFFQTK